MNVSSQPQIQQLLFAGFPGGKDGKGAVPETRAFKVPNTAGIIEEGKKKAKKDVDMTLYGIWGRGVAPQVAPAILTDKGSPATSTPVLRALAGKPGAARKALEAMGGLEGEVPSIGLGLDDLLDGDADDDGTDDGGGAGAGAPAKKKSGAAAAASPPPLPPRAASQAAVPFPPTAHMTEAQRADLRAEAKKNGYGDLYAAFGGGRAGLEACAAFDALCDVNAVDTLLSNFILPLQSNNIGTPHERQPELYSRVHCSLNLNTETGRLSARRPNLQNQPALEKDRYRIRQAFTADRSKGHTLIVADYGQLELRILAHMAQCSSMIRAFELGGDFHSRTAMTMYGYIREDIAKGNCKLESGDAGNDGAPLLKDKYASERRKAKILNFSLAYGKTEHGLAKDFNTSMEEARETLRLWYADRPEVEQWQRGMKAFAKANHYVPTILGRRRPLPNINSSDRRFSGASERAAINTPIQGSAADVASAAMISIMRNAELRALGWKLLLQVHDEMILEGPEATAREAQAIVVRCMEYPFEGQNPLLVDLSVDSDVAPTWFEAK